MTVVYIFAKSGDFDTILNHSVTIFSLLLKDQCSYTCGAENCKILRRSYLQLRTFLMCFRVYEQRKVFKKSKKKSLDFYITSRSKSCNMKHLTLLQRYELQAMRNNGSTLREIALSYR